MDKEELKKQILEVESQKNDVQDRMNKIVANVKDPRKGITPKLEEADQEELKSLSKQMEMARRSN